MDLLPCGSIFNELQIIHDTGYFSALPSLEENWQQVGTFNNIDLVLCLAKHMYSSIVCCSVRHQWLQSIVHCSCKAYFPAAPTAL